MKLAKKMLACAMALAMVAALALTAFAAAPVVTLETKDGPTEDTVVVLVSGKDIAGLKSCDLVIDYDPEVLEFKAVASAFKNVLVGVDNDYDGSDDLLNAVAECGNPEGTSHVTYALAISADSGAIADSNLCVITFKVLDADKASDVTLTYKSWEGTAQPADAKVTVGEAEATTAAPTTAAPTTAAPVEDESVPVSTTKVNEIPATGDVGVAAIAGVMALAAVAFVATRKKDAE